MQPTANAVRPVADRVEVAKAVARFLHESLPHDHLTLIALLWLLRKSRLMSVPVALTLSADFRGVAESDVNDLVASMTRLKEGLNRLITTYDEQAAHFTFAAGWGYCSSVVGGPDLYYRPEMEGQRLGTVWLSRLSYGRDQLTHAPQPNLVILDFPGWESVQSELNQVGMM